MFQVGDKVFLVKPVNRWVREVTVGKELTISRVLNDGWGEVLEFVGIDGIFTPEQFKLLDIVLENK